MLLSNYLNDKGLTLAEFASQIGVSHVSVIRWRDGRAVPRRDLMDKITTATNGAVQPNDFFKPAEVGAA